MKLGLLITMYDETDAVTNTVTSVGKDFDYVGIVQSGEDPDRAVQEKINEIPKMSYALLPNLGDKYSKWELPARALCRNYSKLFRSAPTGLDFYVAITGDTLLMNMWGINSIIESMGDDKFDVACARAMGQDFHRAELTEMELSRGGGGGRFQDGTNSDFMPQLFIVRNSFAHNFINIEVTNKWCSEQCLGDAMNRGCGVPYVFSWQAYGFADGVVYHYGR
jgi:hypothetical protein